MLIESLTAPGADFIAPLDTAAKRAAPTTPPADFTHWLGDQLGEVSDRITNAQQGLASLATGETGNLHHIMLDLSEARLAFQLTLAVRNKVLEGYQDIMRMQV